MTVLLNRVPLAAILGLAIGRIASAETIDMTQAGSFALPAVNAAFSQFSRSPQVVPPLRLALALNRERQHEALQSSESAQEHTAIQSNVQRSSLAASASADNAVFTASDRLAQQPPPLRLALALSREKLYSAPQLSEAAQESAIEFPEPVEDDNVPPQNKTDTPNDEPPQTWEISPSDRTLNTTLARWSVNAGWQLVWDMEVDYPIETRALLQGTFQEAVATVAQSLAGASVPVQATFYEGNRVLRIIAKGGK